MLAAGNTLYDIASGRLPDSKQLRIFLSACLIVFVNLIPPGDFPDNHGNPRKLVRGVWVSYEEKNREDVVMWRECELNQAERDLLRISQISWVSSEFF